MSMFCDYICVYIFRHEYEGCIIFLGERRDWEDEFQYDVRIVFEVWTREKCPGSGF